MSTISASTTSTTAYKVTADTTGSLVLQTGSGPTTAVTIDTSQNMGLGVTPSAWSGSTAFQMNALAISNASANYAQIAHNAYVGSGGWTYKGTGLAMRHQIGQDGYQWHYAASGTAGNAITWTQAMTLDASGNLLLNDTAVSSIGTSITTLQLRGKATARSGGVRMLSSDASLDGAIYMADGVFEVNAISSTPIAFRTNSAERARITSSGYFKASNTGTYISSTGAYHELSSDSSSAYAVYIRSTASATGSFGINLSYPNRAPNDTGNDFITCSDSAATRFTARSNGGLANYSANNVNLSDERTKTDIQDAGGYLAKICAIPVRTFKYKDQTDDLLNLGCIAQEVEAVAPELVDVSGFGETPEDGVPLKAIYQTDLQYALMKCIQEQQAIIETLTNRITALEAK